MPVHQSTKDKQMRQRIAMEAARILADSGLPDYQAAKRKAAQHLGAPDTRNLPSNQEIEQALVDYQRLFQADSQPLRLRHLRTVALEAMRFLAPFGPRLVGPVLAGTANGNAEVQLHLYASAPEEVALFLMEQDVPYQEGERRLRFGRDRYLMLPTYRFVAGDTPVELVVFSVDGQRETPRSPVDGGPMQRASIPAVEALLAEG